MYVAKIEGATVKFYDSHSGALRKTFSCASYKGAKSVNIEDDLAAIVCGDGKTRLFDVHTGTVKRTF